MFPSSRILILCIFCIAAPLSSAAQQLPSPDTLGVRFSPQSRAWLEVRDSAGIIQHAFTFECWIRLRADGIVASRDAYVDTTSDWQLKYEKSRERIVLITHYGFVDEYYYSPDGVLKPGVWSHLALMVNGPDGFVHLYVNGAKVWDFRFAPRHFDARTGLALAGYYENQKGAWIDCDMTEVRYWSGERSADQILRFHRSRIPVSERKSLRGYWRFSKTLADSSGWKNNLRMRGTITYVPAAGLLEDPRFPGFPALEPLLPEEAFLRSTTRLPE